MTSAAVLTTRRRFRTWWLVAAAALALLAIGAVAAWSDGETSVDRAPTPASFPTRTIDVGGVTLKAEPQRIDARGALFKLVFDTHSVELNQDLTSQAVLIVDGTKWPVERWSGDGPGGHHREGELRFTASGPAAGTATLTIGGFSKPITTTWTLPS